MGLSNTLDSSSAGFSSPGTPAIGPTSGSTTDGACGNSVVAACSDTDSGLVSELDSTFGGGVELIKL